MRRDMLLLLCVLAMIGLLYGQFDFFPLTSVLEMPFEEWTTMTTPLREEFIEDELIMIVHPTAIPGASITFNGKYPFRGDEPFPRPTIADGQPIKGEMYYTRFKPAYLYINQPTFDGTNITFTLMYAPDYTYQDLQIQYYIVHKATSMIDYYGNQSGVSEPIQYTHTATETFSPDTHKAVIVIYSAEHEYLQAASTTRALPPFRMVTFSSLCEILDRDLPIFDFQHFYLVNMDMQSEEEVLVHFEMTQLYNEPEFSFSFCDVATGMCFPTVADLPIVTGSSINEYKPTVERFDGQEGSLIINCALNVGDYTVDFRLYFIMPVLNILILQDHAGENRDASVIATHSETFFSFGLWDVATGELTDELLSHFDYVIWNQSGIYPSLSHSSLQTLQRHITQNNAALLAIGQNLAKSLGDINYSSYANNMTIGFLQNILKADIARPASVSNSLHSADAGVYETPLVFELISEGSTANYSTTALQARAGSIPLFIDGNQNTKAVITPTLNNGHITGLFDFDFDSIPATSQLDVMFEGTVWLSTDPDNEGIPKPVSSLNVFPNPALKVMNINYKSEGVLMTNPEYSIYNIKGQKVTSGELKRGGDGFVGQVSLNTLKISSGIYFVRVNEQKHQKMTKVLILK